MTEPPHRPSASSPDARYYFWILETDVHEHLGKYGEEDTDLETENWHLIDFGQTVIDGKKNEERSNFQEKAANLIGSEVQNDPESLAKNLGTLILGRDDSIVWNDLATKISKGLHAVILDRKDEFKNFYSTLKASGHTNNSFGEFFCWYYHLVYPNAIDRLCEKGVISLPPNHFGAIIMYIDDRTESDRR